MPPHACEPSHPDGIHLGSATVCVCKSWAAGLKGPRADTAQGGWQQGNGCNADALLVGNRRVTFGDCELQPVEQPPKTERPVAGKPDAPKSTIVCHRCCTPPANMCLRSVWTGDGCARLGSVRAAPAGKHAHRLELHTLTVQWQAALIEVSQKTPWRYKLQLLSTAAKHADH